jgi:hypothetical protein
MALYLPNSPQIPIAQTWLIGWLVEQAPHNHIFFSLGRFARTLGAQSFLCGQQ